MELSINENLFSKQWQRITINKCYSTWKATRKALRSLKLVAWSYWGHHERGSASLYLSRVQGGRAGPRPRPPEAKYFEISTKMFTYLLHILVISDYSLPLPHSTATYYPYHRQQIRCADRLTSLNSVSMVTKYTSPCCRASYFVCEAKQTFQVHKCAGVIKD